MPDIILDTKYEITQADPLITKGSDTVAGSGDGVTEKRLFLFTNADNQELIFLPDSEFQVYATDNEAAPAELTSYVPIRIIKRDQTGQITSQKMTMLYVNAKFSADVDSRKKLGDKFKLLAKEQLEVLVIPDSAKSLKPSTAKWSLTARRISKANI